MKLSKTALVEILKKCEKTFPRLIGTSMHDSALWDKFCAKKPIEFCGKINGAQYIVRVSNDLYAVCIPNPSGFFKIYSF